jgi:hypothetical protein
MNNNFLPYQLKKNAEQANNLAASLAQSTSQIADNMSQDATVTNVTLSTTKKYSNKPNVNYNATQINLNQNAEINTLNVNVTDTHGVNLPTNAAGNKVKSSILNGSGDVTFYISADNVKDVKLLENVINNSTWYPILMSSNATNGQGFLIGFNKIYSAMGDGIEINLPSDVRNMFRDVRIIGNSITADTPASTPANTSAYNASGFAIGIAEGQDITIIGNVIEGSRKEALHLEDCIENVTVVGNIFNDCNSHGFTIHNNTRASGTLYAKFPTVIGNHFKAKNNTKTVGNNGIWVMWVTGYGYIQGGTFTDNRVEGFDIGVVLDGDGTLSSGFNLNGTIIENCNTGIKVSGHSVAGTITCRNVGKLLSFYKGGVVDRIVSTSNISENDLFSNNLTDGIADIRSFRYPLNPVALTASTTSKVPLFKLPKYMKGILHVRATSNVYGTYHKDIYDITWDGTTLTGATPIISDVNGSYSNMALITEGGYLKVQVGNYNYTTANLIVEFNGAYLFDKTIV